MTDQFKIETLATDGCSAIRVSGALDLSTVERAHLALSGLSSDMPATVDLSQLTALDTAGAWALGSLGERLDASGKTSKGPMRANAPC